MFDYNSLINLGGIAERMGHITVEFRPNFDDTPMKEMWTWSQRPVNLTCRASSIPNATINWWNSRYNALIDENDPRYRIYNKDGESTLLVFFSILFIYVCLFKTFPLELYSIYLF